MNIHLIGFPHTRVDDLFSTCAYTQKVVKFCKMGWENLIVYAVDGSDVGDATLVPVLSEKERIGIFGKDNFKEPPKWPTDDEWSLFNQRATLEVLSLSEPGDLLLLTGGWSQAAIAQQNPHLIACEPGVGYEGVFASFAAFESYAWQHFVYGKNGWDGRWFDTVIPNYFDENDFPLLNKGDGDFLLYTGRVVQRKGLQAAMDIATHAGLPLKVAGPGPTKWRKGRFLSAPEVTIKGDVEYLGVLGVAERAVVMSEAKALLAPTVYVEPFGGVAVEAMLAGTPVISTDWGAFTETVEDGVTGYRFRTLRDAVRAVERVSKLKPEKIRARAIKRYSLKAVKPQFEDWFAALKTLTGKGWYEV